MNESMNESIIHDMTGLWGIILEKKYYTTNKKVQLLRLIKKLSLLYNTDNLPEQYSQSFIKAMFRLAGTGDLSIRKILIESIDMMKLFKDGRGIHPNATIETYVISFNIIFNNAAGKFQSLL